MKSQNVKLYSISNQMIYIVLFTKRKVLDGNTVLNNGKCKMNWSDLYIRSIYSMQPYPMKFIITPRIKMTNISWFIN